MCENTDHLFLGTQKDNMEDCMKKKRHASLRVGSEHNNSKLTQKEALYIQKNYVLGRNHLYPGNMRELKKKFNIGHTTVLRIVHGRHWSLRS